MCGMKRYIVVFALLTCFCRADAAWYWPFGDDEESNEPRISELMEPASRLIDSASDFADDGKIDEAVAEYRKALAELERIEIENPQRAEKPDVGIADMALIWARVDRNPLRSEALDVDGRFFDVRDVSAAGVSKGRDLVDIYAKPCHLNAQKYK